MRSTIPRIERSSRMRRMSSTIDEIAVGGVEAAVARHDRADGVEHRDAGPAPQPHPGT
jgi:hypothetical protein